MKNIKRIVSVLLVAAMLCSMAVCVSAAGFTDIENHWAREYIEHWTELGVINGYGDGTFRPDQKVTRAEVSKILTAAYRLPTDVEETKFSDVSAAEWFYDYVQACAARGIVDGYPNGTFKPNGNITRSEAVKMVCLAVGLSQEETGYEKFSDANQMPAWAAGYWNALIKIGVVEGYENGVLRPNDMITRAEMVKILCVAVEVKIYELTVSITDNLGNVVSDKASYLTGEAYLVNTLLPLLVANRENFAAVYPSGDMRDLLDAGIACATQGYADGWTEEELAAWEKYLEDGFSDVEGEKSLIDVLTDVTEMIAAVERNEDYVMTRFDTEEGRTDIQYTVTLRVEVME